MTKKSVKMEEWNPDEDSKKNTSKPEVQSEPTVDKSTFDADDNIYDVIEGLPASKLYPEGTKIKARPLKVTEVKMLAGMNDNNANDIVNDILHRTVRGIDISEIYSADKLYIMFWLRANTYKESGYNVKFECLKCKKDSEFAFELDQLTIKSITDETIQFLNEPFTLPNKDKITFSLLTVGDEEQNEQFLNNNKTSLMNFDEDIISTCRMIDTVNGKKMGMIDKYMYCTDKLDPGNYTYLESYLEDKGAGLEPTINVKCTKCGGASDTMLPFRPDFFLPKVRV